MWRQARFLKLVGVFIFLPWMLGAAGCPNSLATFAQKDTDEALLFEAQLDANAKMWDEGIVAINKMSTTGLAARGTKVMLASLYAGRCGLDFMNLASDLSNIGSSKFLPFLLAEYKGKTTANAADCKTAEQTLLGISTTFASLTPDENILLALIEMTKIGAVMAQSGLDADKDGILDSAFPIKVADTATYCASNATPSSTVLADSEVQEIGTGIMIMANALSSSGAGVGSAITQVFTPMCTTIAAAPLNLTGFCNQIDTSDFDAADVKVLRMLIRANELGFDQCGGSTSHAACACP